MLSKTTAKEIFDQRLKPRLIVNENGCWTVPIKDNGRGYIYIRVRKLDLRISIHRLSLIAHQGGDVKFALHRCDNPSCCNPDHLFSGTQAENIADMDSKGRRGIHRPYGDDNPSRNKEVRKILSDIAKNRKRDSEGKFDLELGD